jgi:hypothetical protein
MVMLSALLLNGVHCHPDLPEEKGADHQCDGILENPVGTVCKNFEHRDVSRLFLEADTFFWDAIARRSLASHFSLPPLDWDI